MDPNLPSQLPSVGETQTHFPAPMPAATQEAAPASPTPEQGLTDVFDPSGNLVSIPSHFLERAISDEGYRLATPEAIRAQQVQDKYGSGGQQLITGLEKAGSAATFGLSTGIERAMGVHGEDIRGREEANPKSAIAGSIVGLAGTALIPGVGEAAIANDALKGAKAAEEGVLLAKKAFDAGSGSAEALAAAKAAQVEAGSVVAAQKATTEALNPISAASLMNKAGRAAQEMSGIGTGTGVMQGVKAAAIRGAVENSLFQAGDEVSKMFAGDPNQTVGTAVSDVGLSSLIGGTFTAPFGAVSPLWKAAGETKLGGKVSDLKEALGASGPNGMFKKVLSHFGGVSEENINEYLAHHEVINSSPEFKEIYDQALPKIEGIHTAVTEGRFAVKDATEAFDKLEKQMKVNFEKMGYDAVEAKNAAHQSYKTALSDLTSNLQDEALNQAPAIHNAVEALRDQVIEQSKSAYDILENKTVSIEPFFNKADEIINGLRKENSPNSMDMANRIESYIKSIKLSGEGGIELGSDVKRMIQGLDRDSKWSHGATSFDNGLSRYYKDLRRALDTTLKDTVPEYRKAMEPLAKDTKLLASLDNFDTPEGALRRVNALKNKVNYANEMPALKNLEARTGIKFTHDIEPYANPELRNKMFKAVPELKEAERTAQVVKNLKDPKIKQQLHEALQGELAISKEAQAKGMAEEALSKAILDREAVKGVTPATLESKLRSAMRGKFDAEKKISELPKFIDGEGKESSIEELLRHVKVKEAFQKHNTNGSRNVNLFGSMGGVAGEMLSGHLLGGVGAGTMLGSIVDKAGPAGVKMILDAYLKINGKALSKITGVTSSEALRYALAKAVDGTQELSAAGLKAAVQYTAAAFEGHKRLERNTRAVFDPNKKINIDQDSRALQKNLKYHTVDENSAVDKLQGVGGDIHHYFPDHQEALSGTAANAIQYLKSKQFNETPASPLDPKPVQSTAQKYQYERTLGIAEHPNNILGFIQNGTLTPGDITDLKAMYPALYQAMSDQLTHNIIEKTHDGESIPYKTRLSLAMFLGQPLDSTMTAHNIVAAQPKPQQPQQQGGGAPKKSTNSLSKVGTAYQTQGQARENARTSK